MSMCVSSPNVPAPAPRPPEAPRASSQQPLSGQSQGRAGIAGTLLTGPRGLTEQATTQPRTLLGGS